MELRGAQDRLDGRLQTLAADLESSRATLARELRGLREVPAQVDELGRSVEELRARTESPQRAWVRAEALYLLELAERRLDLERDVPTAIVAMESADARLAALNDPALREVRAALGAEIAALRAVPLPDLPDVLARIDRARGRGADAAGDRHAGLRGAPRADATRAGGCAGARMAADRRGDARPRVAAADRAGDRATRHAGGGLPAPPAPASCCCSRHASRRCSPTAPPIGQSLRAAGAWIEQYFDTSQPEVAAAVAEVAALAAISIDPVLPATGRAGRLLQSVIRGNATTP